MAWNGLIYTCYRMLVLHCMMFYFCLLLNPYFWEKKYKIGPKWSFSSFIKVGRMAFFCFCIKLQQRKTFKLTKMISRGKIWLKGFWVKMSSKWKFYEKVALTIFLFFLHKITVACMLKINVLDFLGEKILFWGFWGSDGVKNQYMEHFWVFA